jgi:hypothetical protein
MLQKAKSQLFDKKREKEIQHQEFLARLDRMIPSSRDPAKANEEPKELIG